MTKDERRLKNTLILDLCILAVIAAVSLAAFWLPGVDTGGPALRGNTDANGIGLQIAATGEEDTARYLDALDEIGAKATFFFPEETQPDDAMALVRSRGHGVGTRGENGMYIGGGASVPVMSYRSGSGIRQVAPSIDTTKMFVHSEGAQQFASSLHRGMFVYVDAADDFADFQKIVQIAVDKGYTMLKIDEMLMP